MFCEKFSKVTVKFVEPYHHCLVLLYLYRFREVITIVMFASIFRRQKSLSTEKDEKEEEVPIDEEGGEEEIENNIKEVNVIRSRVGTEKWIAPIDLTLASVKNMHLHKLDWGNVTDMPSKMKATNSGNTVIVSAKWDHTRPHVRGGSLLSTYVFSQLHFHWGSSEKEGSEHRINGISYPLEMHVVFFKSLYLTQDVALTKEDGVVTIVYLFKLTSETNLVLNLITSKLADIQLPHSSVSIDPTPLSTLVYPFTEDYFMYWGKLQTTVCEHPVLWIISRHAFGVSQSQLKDFRNLQGINDEILVKNFRDPCPLNERPVFHVNPSSNLDMLLLPGTVKQDLQLVTVMYNYINECYNKYYTGSKNTSKNVCGEPTKVDNAKVISPGSEKLTKYDYVHNTMQSSGIKILFLLREITNILHQRILQGGTNHGQNYEGGVENKENITDATCAGYPNREGDSRSMRMRNVRRNTEPSILMKPKACKTKTVNNLLRLKQVNSRHAAVSNKQKCLTKNKTLLTFNRPDMKLTQNDASGTPPVDLSDFKHLFLPQNNLKKPDEKLVSKIQTEITRLNKSKQIKDKKPVLIQDGPNYFNLLKKETSKTSLSPSVCRTTSIAENKNPAFSNDFIPLQSSGNPCFTELSTIREESSILKEETSSLLNNAAINEDKNKRVEGVAPLLNEFGVDVSQNGESSQKMFLKKNEVSDNKQFCNIQIVNDCKKSTIDENSVFRIKKLAALSKQLMNVFHFKVLPDHDPPVSYNLNTNYLNEQKSHIKQDKNFLVNKEDISGNDVNVENSIKDRGDTIDDITVKQGMPVSLNHQVMNLAEHSEFEVNPYRLAPVKNGLEPFRQKSGTGDSQLVQNKNCSSSNKKSCITSDPGTELCGGCPSSRNVVTQLDINSVHGDTVNAKMANTMINTNKFQNDGTVTVHLELMPHDVQEPCLNETEILDEVNPHGLNLIQQNVNTIRNLFPNEQYPPQKKNCLIESEAVVILNEEQNFIHRNMTKRANQSIVIEDMTAENHKNTNFVHDMTFGSSPIAQSPTHMEEERNIMKENNESLKIKISSNNLNSFSEHGLFFNQDDFKTTKESDNRDVHFNKIENHKTIDIRKQQEKNYERLSAEERQEIDEQGFDDISKKTNYNDLNVSEEHCNRNGKRVVTEPMNEHVYNNEKTIEQINKHILSLFEQKDNNDNINSNSKDKVVSKVVPQRFFKENFHVDTKNPVFVEEVNTVENTMLSNQLTSLYENLTFEDAVTNPNSESSSRIPSVTSMNTVKSMKKKVADQIGYLQKHLYTAQHRSEKVREPTKVRSSLIRRKTCTVHSDTQYKKNVTKNDSVKTDIPTPQYQNVRENISKIPKPIPVYTKAKRKLETKIPRAVTRPGTNKEIKCSGQTKK